MNQLSEIEKAQIKRERIAKSNKKYYYANRAKILERNKIRYLNFKAKLEMAQRIIDNNAFLSGSK